MNKLITNILIIFSFITSPLLVLADAPSPTKFKNFNIKMMDDKNIEITHDKEKINVEILGENRYKLNGVVASWNATDTVEVAYEKVEKAYKRSKKKSAQLDRLFINEASAIVPWWFAMTFGGMIGAGLASASCNRRAAQPAYGAPAAQ